MPQESDKLPWLFVDGTTQQIFRIRSGEPSWQADDEQDFAMAECAFHIVADDGNAFDFVLRISGNVLADQSVENPGALRELIGSKGVEIVEGAINKGIRGDQQLLWEPDGVSVIA